MASWVNIKASESLLAELNIAFPNRDHASDGTVGDQRHSQESSDHNPDETGRTPFEDADSLNEVHARDIDSDLKRAGWTLFRVFEIIRKRAEAGKEQRVQNMICDGKITSRSWGFSGWHAYGGTDQHRTHGHVSFRYGSGSGQSNPENITVPWGILAAVQTEQQAATAAAGGTDVALASEIFKLTNQTADALGKARGDSMNGSILLQTIAIHAAHGAGNGHTAATEAAATRLLLATVATKLNALLQDPAELDDPETHPLVRAFRYMQSTPPPALAPAAPATTTLQA